MPAAYPPTQARTTDSPLRVPLVSSIASRDGTYTLPGKDARLVNCYAELDPTDGGYWVQKRPGFSTPVYSPAAAGNGMYFWETAPSIGALYSVAGNVLYKAGVNLATLSSPTAPFFWQQVRSSPALLVLGDGTNAYYTDGTTVTNLHAHDADFPATFVPGWAYLDGTLYVMASTGNIQGSAIDDPTTWDPLNVIVAR